MAPIQKIVALIRPGQGDLATIQEACPESSNMVRGRPMLQCGFGWLLVSCPWRENWGRENKEIVETVATRDFADKIQMWSTIYWIYSCEERDSRKSKNRSNLPDNCQIDIRSVFVSRRKDDSIIYQWKEKSHWRTSSLMEKKSTIAMWRFNCFPKKNLTTKKFLKERQQCWQEPDWLTSNQPLLARDGSIFDLWPTFEPNLVAGWK